MTAQDGHLDHASALRRACAAAGLDPSQARLLHHYSNAIYLLPSEGAVARITTGDDALVRVQRTQAVTRWLVERHGFPATEPLPGSEPVPVDARSVVSFWVYYAPPAQASPPTSADLARILTRLHRIELPPFPLPTWTPLVSLQETVDSPALSASIAEDERLWIRARIDNIREALAGMDWPLGTGLIHGDAWAGNLLPCTDNGARCMILGDWDWVSVGPREVDLIPTWHAATRYGKGPRWASGFVDQYDYDLARWSGYPTLMAMRDLVQLTGPIRRANDDNSYQAALRQRLDDLRVGDTSHVWAAL